jgi:hypothetical protein
LNPQIQPILLGLCPILPTEFQRTPGIFRLALTGGGGGGAECFSAVAVEVGAFEAVGGPPAHADRHSSSASESAAAPSVRVWAGSRESLRVWVPEPLVGECAAGAYTCPLLSSA